MSSEKILEQYIGDGVYVHVAPYRSLIIEIFNGVSVQNRIEIDVGDIDRFINWCQRAKEIAHG